MMNKRDLFVELFRIGDERAFELFFLMEFNNVVYFLTSYVKDESAAKDIAQESFIAMWHKRKGLRYDCNIRGYIYTIARNKALNFIRGRSIVKTYLIIDEAQNTTREQMKMFLTRLGANSKAVITGDVTQIDLPDARKSGLIDAMKVLAHVDDIDTVLFNDKDVVRNRIVQEIIKAYAKFEKKGER